MSSGHARTPRARQRLVPGGGEGKTLVTTARLEGDREQERMRVELERKSDDNKKGVDKELGKRCLRDWT